MLLPRRLPLLVSALSLSIIHAPDTFSELKAVVESYQAKEQSYQQRLEAAEIARAKAARAEAFGMRLSFLRIWAAESSLYSQATA